ncbi:helix-turn-helix domain-containing protein [Streptomyces sp. NBC_01465]|uniref:helix-turn-helix domain-containing protein n=1 Tax=Streptomyces sp. NBC_01465 TaxID=2903878 RepID=UPI002E381122|nr:helix-turn-helix domain-containing protein [Streptomyces sp. NBC_01465]
MRTRAFTVLGNDVLRDRRLSFTARGLLAYLLSLPDGAREDARTLADKNPGIGRRGISKALDELVEHGYYVRCTTHDPESGQVRTETFVFDVPQDPDAPLPAPAGTGEAQVGNSGASPLGAENPVEEPSHPDADIARGAALLGRLGRVEPKLALSVADTLALAPLALPWLDCGVSESAIRALLADGLPPVVFSARGILGDRLVRKLPAQQGPPAPVFAECGDCHDPLPRGQEAGICEGCTGVTPLVAVAHPTTVNERVAAIRATLRSGLGGTANLAR